MGWGQGFHNFESVEPRYHNYFPLLDSLYLRIFCTERQLLRMVRSVSEDRLNDTIEFNEFLQMMSKQQEEAVERGDLVEAFK